MTIDNLKIPTVALGTWAWGDSGETGDGYFGSHSLRLAWKRSRTRRMRPGSPCGTPPLCTAWADQKPCSGRC